MKKFLVPIVAVIVLILGFAFLPSKDKGESQNEPKVEQSAPANPIAKAIDSVVGNKAGELAEKYINQMLENSQFFEVKERKFDRGDSSSAGYFTGVIKKQTLKDQLAAVVASVHGETEAKDLQKLNSEMDEIFPQDLEFRYDYTIAHSVANIADGAQIEGKIKTITPHYAEILKQFFKTEEIVTNRVTIATDIKFIIQVADAEYSNEGVMINLSGLNFGGVSDLNGEILKTLNLSLDKFFVYGVEGVDIEMQGLNYDMKYKNGIKKGAELVDYFLADMSYTSSLKNALITVEGDRFIVANDASSEGETRISGGKYFMDDKSRIANLKVADVLVRNVAIDSDIAMSEKLYRELAFANQNKAEELAKNPQILRDLLKDDISLNLKNLSFENSIGKKFSLSAKGVVGDFVDEETLFAKMSASGSAKIDTSLGEFVSDYDSLRPFAPLIELYSAQFLRPEGNGVRLDFSYDKASNLLQLNGENIPLQ
ncbi:YdgA family protein [Campylobacter sp. VBCF_05 NA6]|uniref:hypothetical protein n=1 Tax=unclassified Campylobacter TaxID=2593542 RepID=UPI0022E99CA6|nr:MULTISPECIES: hypothetical protein [unclassified Campylobacter]MDA3058216.1 YdgA family protein [Campylobacter sp. VBCF_04 NA7]MDA3059787.1 YdgA family protein [Campylobacter sp. VBCF_05 NA6]